MSITFLDLSRDVALIFLTTYGFVTRLDHHREDFRELLIKQEVFSIMSKRIVQKLFTLLS